MPRTVSRPTSWTGQVWKPALLVAAVALAASITGIRNDYASDDIPLIVDDVRAHSFAHLLAVFTTSYWPDPPFFPDLYRPFSTLSFTVQWTLGGSSPLIFRVVSYLLYMGVAIGVLALARRIFPPAVALGTAVLFAAHPVHAEAVALGVNQAEQWVALLALLMTIRYLDRRRRGWPGRSDWMVFGALYLAACLFKEHALVIPGLLLAAELTVLGAPPGRERWPRLLPGFACLAAVGAGFLAVRTVVLQSFVGSFTAEALVGQGIFGRTLTMLQVVPDWVRLLAWPARMLGDYSPVVIEQANHWGVAQTAGAAILLALVGLGWLLRGVAPSVPFGLLWAGAAILPVSNVIAPTGIVLAERSLYLPSVGFLLALGGVATVFMTAERPRTSLLLAVATVVLALLGVARSATRHTDWRNNYHYWARTLQQAPLNHKAYHALGQMLYREGHEAEALRAFHVAVTLHPRAFWIHHELGDLLRDRGECRAALIWYAESLRVEPDQPTARVSRINCFLELGMEEEAADEAARARAFLERGEGR